MPKKRHHVVAPAGYRIIWRRFRRGRDGRMLDAYWYGHRAWPIIVPE